MTNIFIAVLKALSVTFLLFLLVICIYIYFVRFSKECDDWDVESRKLFGGDLYNKKKETE